MYCVSVFAGEVSWLTIDVSVLCFGLLFLWFGVNGSGISFGMYSSWCSVAQLIMVQSLCNNSWLNCDNGSSLILGQESRFRFSGFRVALVLLGFHCAQQRRTPRPSLKSFENWFMV